MNIHTTNRLRGDGSFFLFQPLYRQQLEEVRGEPVTAPAANGATP